MSKKQHLVLLASSFFLWTCHVTNAFYVIEQHPSAIRLHRHHLVLASPTTALCAANAKKSPIDGDNDDDDDDDDDDTIGIGIDLGTTNSAVAYLNADGIPTIIPIPENGRTMPSLVALVDNDHYNAPAVVGKQAQFLPYYYSHVKRVIGTGGKVSADVQQVVPHLRVNPHGKTYKKNHLDNQLHDAEHYPTLLQSTLDPAKTVRPQEISSHIVAHLKQVAEDYTGRCVTRAVVGVPAYFNDAQRAATLEAAQTAGIDKVKLLREPEAAALAYGAGKQQLMGGTAANVNQQQQQEEDDELVLAFDLGGGTFDVSMLVVGGGVSEIICTAGNAQLGGADFDARIAQHLTAVLSANSGVSAKKFCPAAQNVMVQAAEQIRIYLSNNRKAILDLPATEEAWLALESASDVIVKDDKKEENDTPTPTPTQTEQTTTTTTLSCIRYELTRREMERLCKDEFQALLRPVREVAIMAGALLPGDTSPTLVEAALEMEEWSKQADDALAFGDFYPDENQENGSAQEDEIDSDTLLQLQEAALKEAKRSQQKGRKRARDLAKEERKFRQQKRQVAETSSRVGTAATAVDGIKVQDGITGRPISRVVLVGGATRMPAVGRLIGALTGVTPQKTVNPDEAVALGCAANVGILDGVDGMGKVLSPMQAAILRAMAEQKGLMLDDEEDFDDAEFGEVEYF